MKVFSIDNDLLIGDPVVVWRRGSDSNRRIEVLQTPPLATWVPRLLSH